MTHVNGKQLKFEFQRNNRRIAYIGIYGNRERCGNQKQSVTQRKQYKMNDIISYTL